VATRRAREDRRDPRIEKWLDSNGVPFSFHEEPIPMTDIDLERSLQNQARYKELDHGKVVQYAEAMVNGDQFPPIILNRTSARAKYLNVDGNHRINAAAHNEYDAWDYGWYEINVKAQMFTLLAMQANTKHGLPTDNDERARQAVYMIDNGSTVGQAAAALSVPVRDVERRLQKVKQERRVAEAGISMSIWEKIANPSKTKLATIFTNEGFSAATELTHKAALTISEVGEMVAAVNATRTGSTQRKIVADFASMYSERIQATGGGVLASQTGKSARSPRSRYAAALSFLGGVQDLTVVAESFAMEEREGAAERARHEGERLIQLSEKLIASLA